MFPHIVEIINHTEIRVELVKGGFLNYWHSPNTLKNDIPKQNSGTHV